MNRVHLLLARVAQLPPEPEPGSRWENARGRRLTVTGYPRDPGPGLDVVVPVAWDEPPWFASEADQVQLARFYAGTGLKRFTRLQSEESNDNEEKDT